MSSILDLCAEEEKARRFIPREMTPDDIRLATEWMSHRYGGAFPQDFFPKTGVAVEYRSRLIAVIPLYLEASGPVAVAGHAMCAPDPAPRDKFRALECAMRYLVEYAERHHRKYLVTLYGRRSVNRIADKLGFVTTDSVEEKFIKLEV